MNKLRILLNPNSPSYAAAMLVTTIIACAGTWIVPFITSLASQAIFGINLQTSIPPNTQSNELINLIIDIAWLITFVIGSLSTWSLIASFALIVDRVFDLQTISVFLTKKRMLQYMIVMAGIYIVLGIFASIGSSPSLFSVFGALEIQGVGMLMASGLGTMLTPMLVRSGSNKTRLWGEEPTNEDIGLWTLSYPFSFAALFSVIFCLYPVITILNINP